ncbi:oxidoreductase [Acrocarpospora corrugata]|uniref:Oxidoreductase n=1 Tax=Acrocarpospora corrugata TaxID=35763 RepID=A0A5M3W3J0_9ACTN|nr:Gfo/Idh/MocA family oxidoreductase [Acrocarpospora corrugata]GES01711.1 oxidoreductase [Acrocarpospora corrugata]
MNARGVALIGCGNIGINQHIPAWLERPNGYHLAAVADPDPRRREAARRVAGLAPEDALDGLDAVLARPDIGVVDLSVPPGLRLELVRRAAGAGKHILTEKPLATTPAAAEAMVEICRAGGVTFGVVHNYLFFPELVAARALIDSGAIGDVEVAILNYLGCADNPGAAEYIPAWRKNPEMSGGGVLMDLLHVVYVAESLLGRPIDAASAYVTARSHGGVEEIASCRFETRDAVALVNVGWGHGPGGIDVSGSHGRLAIRYRGGGTSPFAPFESLELTTPAGTTRIEVPAPTGFLSPVTADFTAALATGTRPAATGEDALRVLEATVAAYASAASGATVALPLDRADPAFTDGVLGLSRRPISPRGAVARLGLFGVSGQDPVPA